jgi:hypothetical protein
MTVQIRMYQPEDKPACIEIFKSNQPRFFADDELEEFVSFLDELPCPYLCLVHDETVVGCGGLFYQHRKKGGRHGMGHGC